MNKELEQKLKNEFIAKRNHASLVAENNLNRALNDAEFHDVYTSLNEKTFRLISIDGDSKKSEEIKSLKKSIKELKEKKVEILKRLNLKESDFVPQYECKKFNDSGMLDDKYCSCFERRKLEELVKASGLTVSSLNDFSVYDENIAKNEEQRETLKKLKDILLRYADKFGSTKLLNIIICGKTGVGKTFALECVANEIMKKGFSCYFFSAFGINNQFVKYHTCFDANKQSYLDILLDPDLLIIDDLGSEPVLKNVTREYLYLILEERMLKHKSTMISTNLNQSEIIDRYGERIFSRLFNKSKSYIFKINGDDLRLNKK